MANSGGKAQPGGMDSLDYGKDSFGDIIAKDPRYSPRAYTLLADVLDYLFSKDGHVSAADRLDEFRERTLDLFGPMSLCVLNEWGLTCTKDVGEMMFNMVESRRINQEDGDTAECFADVYDFEEAFHAPYEA